MSQKWIELFQGLSTGAIPFDNTGFIVATHFDTSSNYTIVEIVSFKNVKNIAPHGDGVTFHSDGFKSFIVYEPITYRLRFMEPYLRDGNANVPLRWKELHKMEMPNHDRVFVSLEPYMSYGSFTVEKPSSGNFVFYIFQNEQARDNIREFITTLLTKDLKVPKSMIREVMEHVDNNIDYFQRSAN